MPMLLLLGSAWLVLVVLGWSLFATAARADRGGWRRPPAPPPRR